jgi:hypothetical protein
MTYFGGFRYKFPEPEVIIGEKLTEIGDACQFPKSALYAALAMPDFKGVYYFLMVCVYYARTGHKELYDEIAELICNSLRSSPTEETYSAEQKEYICKIMQFLFRNAVYYTDFKTIFNTLAMLEYKHPNDVFGFLLIHLFAQRQDFTYSETYQRETNGDMTLVDRTQSKRLVTGITYPYRPKNVAFIVAYIAYMQENRYFYHSPTELFYVQHVVRDVESAVRRGFLPRAFLHHTRTYCNSFAGKNRTFGCFHIEQLGWFVAQRLSVEEKYSQFFEGALALAQIGLPLYVALEILDFLVADRDISRHTKVRRLESIYRAFGKRRFANKLQLIPYVSQEFFLYRRFSVYYAHTGYILSHGSMGQGCCFVRADDSDEVFFMRHGDDDDGNEYEAPTTTEDSD